MTALAPSSVQAIALNGSVAITSPVFLGDPNLGNPVNTTIDWITGGDGKEGTVNAVTGDFANFVPNLLNKRVDLTDISLTRSGPATTVPGFFSSADYNSNAVTNFIDFGNVTLNNTTANLSFDLNAGVVQRIVVDPVDSIVELTPTGISGTFNFNNQTVATGNITAAQSPITGGIGVISITAVPEPITIGGIALGTSFGAFLKKRYSKNGKKLAKV